MVWYQKIKGADDYEGSAVFCIEGVNEKTAYKIISFYLTEHLRCDVFEHEVFEYAECIPTVLKKDGIFFRYDPFDSMMGIHFCSPDNKKMSDEYYDKLEKIVQELVNALNRDIVTDT